MTSPEWDGQFSEVLDECCRRVQHGEALEVCLADYPASYRNEIAGLAPLVGRLGQLGSDPSPEFRARLERNLLASVDEARQRRREGVFGHVARFFSTATAMRFAVLALVALIVVGASGVGVVQASDNSLPDSPLYQLKVVREWAELALARDGEAVVSAHARQIAERGRELQRAVRTGNRRVVDALAVRIYWSVERIVDKALEIRARGNPQPAARALVAIRVIQRQVDRLAAQASPEVRPSLQRLRFFLEQQERRLTEGGPDGPAGRTVRREQSVAGKRSVLSADFLKHANRS